MFETPVSLCSICSVHSAGDTVSSGGGTGVYSRPQNTNTNNTSVNMVSIPARTFENITANRTGIFFSFYVDETLFPLRLNQTISENTTYKEIGSAVLSATVSGTEIKRLTEMITISMSITSTVSYQPFVAAKVMSKPSCTSYYMHRWCKIGFLTLGAHAQEGYGTCLVCVSVCLSVTTLALTSFVSTVQVWYICIAII